MKLSGTGPYTGAYTDVVTLDQLNGVRWYNPATQRWITQDPAEIGTNWDEYCDNDPTNGTDPTGEGCLLNPLLWCNGAGNPQQSWLDYLNPFNSESRAAAAGAFLGTTQGAANSVNGAQDAAFGVWNSPTAVRNHFRSSYNQIPLRDSPQWAAGTVVQLDPTVQKASQFCAGQGLFTVVTCGLGTAAEGAQIPGATLRFGASLNGSGQLVVGGLELAPATITVTSTAAQGSVVLANGASLTGQLSVLQTASGNGGPGQPLNPAPSAITPRNAHLAGKTHPVTGVPFDANGYPDFSSVATQTVEITQTGNRAVDFAAANRAAGLAETPKGFTWHHNQNGTTMQLVPTPIHAATGHTGGVALGGG